MLKQQRKHAIALLESKQDNNNPLDVDYLIDDECRRILKLPPRPANAIPYAGWMVGEKKVSSEPTKTSKAGIGIIKRWEGMRRHAYLCPGNVWTIGYGHTATAKPGMVISRLEAENLLKQDLVRFEDAVRRYVKVPINQNQFDALVSFAFNVGTGALKTSSLLRILNEGRYRTASLQFKNWVYAGGKKLPGLINRRKSEYELFNRE